MYSVSASLKKDCLLTTESSVYDSHLELRFKVLQTSYPSDVEVDFILFYIIGEETFDTNDFHFVVEVLSYLLK